MRAFEELREEHRKELVREKDEVDFERKCAEEWMRDLKASFKVDKRQLEECVATLQKKLETAPRGVADEVGAVSVSERVRMRRRLLLSQQAVPIAIDLVMAAVLKTMLNAQI